MYAGKSPFVRKESVSLDSFCNEYARLIEDMIDFSNNGRCPKIPANYDSQTEQTIRPLNSTLFYMYYSGTSYTRFFSKWLMSAARYPNEKVRRAYMKFFD